MRLSDIPCSWVRTIDAVLEPLDLDELKAHARITDTSSDTLIETYGIVARQACEAYLGRGLLTQTWQLTLDDFADVIPLPMAAPLQAVTSVTYYDENGVQQTLATSVYGVDTNARPGAVVLKVDQAWPALQSQRLNGRVTVTYRVGWESADEVPELIKQGLRMYVTYLDLDRAGTELRAADARQAAERCWVDRITWTPPQRCY